MKCPHCGIEVRDTTVICGYCGGKIPQRSGKPASAPGTKLAIGGSTVQKAPPSKKHQNEEPEAEEEEEGGLSAYLQPGEHVLIGSLNISVKKFFFHAYLTDKRIFLIDTQEKKLKVTAKDIPLESIAGSIVEFSENSDPVLVISIKSPDDEIKSMKLVFAQDGMDRSSEIDEWIALLEEQTQPKRQKKPSFQKEPKPEPEEEQEIPAHPQKPVSVRSEFQPIKKQTKDLEKQPPVKRLISLYQTTKEEEHEIPEPKARQVIKKTTIEPTQKPILQPKPYREIPASTPHQPETKTVKRVEVQSVMKTAMKDAMQPSRQPTVQPTKRIGPEPEEKVKSEPAVSVVSDREKKVIEKEPEPIEDETAVPFFCYNCGKKLPISANFCPGCGNKLGHQRSSQTKAQSHEKKSTKSEEVPEEDKTEHRPSKTPVKRAPKGSEMTILHKFLRR